MRHEKFPVIPEDECTRQNKVRAEITLVCEVRQGIRPWTRVRLMDISQTGFRVAWYPGVNPQEPLKIRIPGLQLLTAKIRWRARNALGCAFADPLHIAVFEHIVRQAQFDTGQP